MSTVDAQRRRRPRVPRSRSRTASGLSLALVLGLVLGLAACGSTDEGPTAGQTVAGTQLADQVGAAITSAGSGRVTFDGGGFSASGTLSEVGGRLDQQVIAKASSQTVELVRVGDGSWARGLSTDGDAAAAEARARPWRSLTEDAVGALAGQEEGLVACLDITSPHTLVAALATTSVTVLQADATSRTYRAVVEPETLLGDLAASSGVTEPITLTLVLDGRDRPLGVTADVSGQSLRLSYAEWGQPVTVTAPAAAQVARR